MTGAMCIVAPNGWLLAQNGGVFDLRMMIGLFLVMIVFMFVMNAPRRKEEKLRKEMLRNLQKNDRVLTRGGVICTVVGVKGNEITVKVDEASNTKNTLMRSYVDRVLTDEEREKLAAAPE